MMKYNKKAIIGIICAVVVAVVCLIGMVIVPRIFYTDVETIQNMEKEEEDIVNSNADETVEEIETETEDLPEEDISPVTPFRDGEEVTFAAYENTEDKIFNVYGIGNESYEVYEYLALTDGYFCDAQGTSDGKYLFYSSESGDGWIMNIKTYDGSVDEEINIRSVYRFDNIYIMQNRYMITYGNSEQGEGWYLYDIENPEELVLIGTGITVDAKAANDGSGFLFWGKGGLYYYEVGSGKEAKCLVTTDVKLTLGYVNEEDLSVISYIQDGSVYCIFNQQQPILYGNAEKVIYADMEILVCDKGVYKNGACYNFENSCRFVDFFSSGGNSCYSEIVAYDKTTGVAYLRMFDRNEVMEETWIMSLFFYNDKVYVEPYVGLTYSGDTGNVLFADEGYIYTEGLAEDFDDSDNVIQGKSMGVGRIDWEKQAEYNLTNNNAEFVETLTAEYYNASSNTILRLDEFSMLSEEHWWYEEEEWFIYYIVPLSKGSAIINYTLIEGGRLMDNFSVVFYNEGSGYCSMKPTYYESGPFKWGEEVYQAKELQEDIFLVSGKGMLKIIDYKGNLIKVLHEEEEHGYSQIFGRVVGTVNSYEYN